MSLIYKIASIREYLVNVGVDESLPPQEVRKVRLVNGILLTGELLFMLIIVKSLIMQVPEEWPIQLAGALVFPMPILFNKWKKYNLARLFCLLIPFLYLSLLTLYWGSERGSQLIIFACSGLAVLFFDKRVYVYLLIALGGLCIIAVEMYNFDHEPIYRTEQLKVAYVINIMITIILLAVISSIFRRENEKYQKSIQRKNSQITNQHSQLLQLHNDLKESVRLINEQTKYARTIQQAILPLKEEMEDIMPDHFLFFKPRDMVSGDFYFVTKIRERIFIAVVDCTGHGVPGAFMSMIGYNLLLEAIELNFIFEPAKILDYLQQRIVYALKQQQTDNNDGMDISICVIDREQQVLSYAGAKHPLLLIENGEMRKIEADRVSIGGILGRPDLRFRNHKFDLSTITGFYMFTDGYRDQYGGEEFKRFMSKRFRKLLLNNCNKRTYEQKAIVEQTFTEWRGKNEQTDDVLIIGVKL
ncbi:SpoIIE family protein phosphatase [Fulvivirga sp. 29W222]|uniref:SpoIIE family protein phosphatase n=1 Tax=Fulvivirga marina TaxID=2494733 RepID=A0A937KE14_9BACT|nr:SpoIIE family protein phosphatase [Fulvivirga marina]MBL6449059.1 SpoIIE family protein phosphatase [Fulvivirga marina]